MTLSKQETPILCFVGRSNSGKTTLIERVIPELVKEGYRIATIKHAGHGFDLDTEGKDSWRHKQAGAETVVVMSKASLAVFTDVQQETTLPMLRDRYINAGTDLIIAEGWKSEGYPKIVIVREHVGEVDVSFDGLLAVVSNKQFDHPPAGVPVFDPDDIPGITAVITSHFSRHRASRC
jgi:molybdopterin-guanine dinucleotide biosynthesis protein B